MQVIMNRAEKYRIAKDKKSLQPLCRQSLYPIAETELQQRTHYPFFPVSKSF